MVASIGFGLLALSVFFPARIARLRMHTVSEMLSLRYGDTAGIIAGVVMWIYTLMLAVTCTIAYASVFDVLFDVPRWLAVVIGGVIVAGYSALGGMWSITLTDMVQFVVKSFGVVLLLLPVAVVKAGGFAEMADKLPTGYLSPTSIGGQTIFTYVLIYTFGMLIGQGIWQRVFTARNDRVASLGGTVAGVSTAWSTRWPDRSSGWRPRFSTRTWPAPTAPSPPSWSAPCPPASGVWCWPPHCPR